MQNASLPHDIIEQCMHLICIDYIAPEHICKDFNNINNDNNNKTCLTKRSEPWNYTILKNLKTKSALLTTQLNALNKREFRLQFVKLCLVCRSTNTIFNNLLKKYKWLYTSHITKCKEELYAWRFMLWESHVAALQFIS